MRGIPMSEFKYEVTDTGVIFRRNGQEAYIAMDDILEVLDVNYPTTFETEIGFIHISVRQAAELYLEYLS